MKQGMRMWFEFICLRWGQMKSWIMLRLAERLSAYQEVRSMEWVRSEDIAELSLALARFHKTAAEHLFLERRVWLGWNLKKAWIAAPSSQLVSFCSPTAHGFLDPPLTSLCSPTAPKFVHTPSSWACGAPQLMIWCSPPPQLMRLWRVTAHKVVYPHSYWVCVVSSSWVSVTPSPQLIHLYSRIAHEFLHFTAPSRHSQDLDVTYAPNK